MQTRRARLGHATLSISAMPVEIFHQIFSYFIFDRHKETLSSCALVSKFWLQVARPHLFAMMQVERKRCFSTFLRFIDLHPDLAGHIQELTFASARYRSRDDADECCCDDHERPKDDPEAWPPPPRLDLGALTVVFPKLTKLKELMLQEITVAIPKSAPSASPDANAYCARKLEVLVIKDVTTCEHDNGPVLPAVLDALSPSSIESLIFDRLGKNPRCDTPDHSEDPDVTLEANLLDLWGTRPPLDVQHLSLSDPSWVGTAAHFRFYEQKMVQPGCLRSLETRCDSWKITEQVFAFLHTCGSKHFECLQLDIIPLVENEMPFSEYCSITSESRMRPMEQSRVRQ
ncbi:hypothetical protein BD309DRAFT_47739 [Dichomitus squalens]|nr:hypothetical protein BD309DRAFT_47739 [Dichomitus squalens]